MFDIRKWQDHQATDTPLFKQFLNYWSVGQYDQALAILSNPDLQSKSLMASVLNTISAALEYLQNNYFHNVEGTLAENIDALNLAIYRFQMQNAYSPTKQYYVNNFVIYDDLVYMCTKDSYGILPTDATHWELIGLKGEAGAFGTGLNLRYTWSFSTSYNKYDVVYLDSVLYVALQNNQNKNPVNTTGFWQVFMKVPKSEMTISRIRPNDPYLGQIWIRLLLGAYNWQEVDNRNYTFANIDALGIDWAEVDKGGW